MSLNLTDLCGWHRDDDAVAAFNASLIATHGTATFRDSQPGLQGHWNRLVAEGVCHVLAQTYERIACKQNLPAELQRRGTCVSRGTFRACQDSYYYELATVAMVGKPARLAFEPIYGGSRVNIGRGRLGTGDGSVGAWAAEFVSSYGLIERGIHGPIDLTQPREDLAVLWGNPAQGCPVALLNLGRQHTVRCHRVLTVDELADCIAAGYFAAYCSNIIWGDRDRNGMSRPSSSGGHCEEIAGVFLTPSGRTAFVRQQSWGELPNGPDVLATKSGPITLRQGSYGATADDMQRGLDNGGECWAFQVKSPWRASTKELLS